MSRILDAVRGAIAKTRPVGKATITAIAALAASALAIATPQPAYAFETSTQSTSYTNNGMTIDSVRIDGTYLPAYEGNKELDIKYTAGGKTYNGNGVTIDSAGYGGSGNLRVKYTLTGHISDYKAFKTAAIKASATSNSKYDVSALYGPLVIYNSNGCALHTENTGNLLAVMNGIDNPTQTNCTFEMSVMANMADGVTTANLGSSVTGIEIAGTTWEFATKPSTKEASQYTADVLTGEDPSTTSTWNQWDLYNGSVYDAYTNGEFTIGQHIISEGFANYMLRHGTLPNDENHKPATDNLGTDNFIYVKIQTTAILPDGTTMKDKVADPQSEPSDRQHFTSMAHAAYSDTRISTTSYGNDKSRTISASSMRKLDISQMRDVSTAKANTPIGTVSYAYDSDGTMYICSNIGPFMNNSVYGGDNYDTGLAVDSMTSAQIKRLRSLGFVGMPDLRNSVRLTTENPEYVHKIDFTITWDGIGMHANYDTDIDGKGDWYGKHSKTTTMYTKELGGSAQPYVVLKYDKNLDAATGTMDPTYSTPGTVKMRQNAFYAKGYDFLGWADTPDGPVKYADEASIQLAAGEKTVYAKWRSRSYKLSATTTASAAQGMTTSSADAVHDTISTTVLDENGNTASDELTKIAQYDTPTVDVTLHYGGYGTNRGTTVTKQATITPGKSANSPDFTPSDFKFKNRNGQEEAWKTWGKGDYWFTISIPRQGNMQEGVTLDKREDSESFTVTQGDDEPHKALYDETDKRVVNEDTEQLVYGMTYYAQILAYPEGSSDLWIRDVIDTTDVTVDDTNAYVTGPDGSKVQADIKTTQSNGQTTTIAHVSGIVQSKGAYTLHVPQAPGARTTSWVIKDTPGWSVTGPNQFTNFVSHQLPVQPPTPDKVWVLDEDGALTAEDPNGTNAISDVENGHADTKTFLLGDAIGAVVNGKIRKSLVDPLKSYSITDDVSGSSKYVKWDVSKTKVFIDGKDCTAYFDVSMSGNRITATAKDSFLKANTGVINGFGKSDHVVKLYVAGVITAVGQKGETMRLVNDASESVNGDERQTNEPYAYVWQPNPDKAWATIGDDGKLNATVSGASVSSSLESGNDKTFLDGDALGSVVNGIIPSGLAEVPNKFVLYDDWTDSNYLVDPDSLDGMRVYESDVTDTSKSTVQDIVRTGKDVTKYFTVAYDSTDLTQASKCTATAKKEYLDSLRNLAKGKQVTLVIPMHANYANGKGAEQVRKDYGADAGDEVVMTNNYDGKPFTNIAGEVIGGSTVETNAPRIHGYVPPVTKDVLAAADESGDQRSIDGGKTEPGDKVEYVLTTKPEFPSDLSYAIKQVTIRDKYDDLLTISKQTLEVHDLNGGSIIPRSKYSISWDDEGHQFIIAITDKQLLEQWKANGTPRLQVRFEATMATEDKIPDSRKGKDNYVVIDNQWFLRINTGNEITSNITRLYIPPFKPDKKDAQSADQGTPKISIDGKTLFLGDTGEYRITIDASEYSAPSETDKTTDAYNVYRLGIVDDYDDEYLSADAANVRVLDEKGSDVTGKFNVQVKDGILYVFAKLVDTVVPSTQETVKATQPDDLKAYAESTKHDPETEPAIDQSLLGQKYTVVMPYKVTKVEDGYVVKNQAMQEIDDRKSQLTNIVTNPVKKLDPKKDVTIIAGGDYLSGNEITLNTFFNYKLESTAIPVNRAYPKVTRWGITDSLDEKYDKFSGQWVVIARNDVYGKDGSVLFKAGDVIAESKAYHAATAKAKALEGTDVDADAQDDATDASNDGNADAKGDADDDKAGTDDGAGSGASANDAGTKSDDADADATASDDASKDASDESGDGKSGDADDASASDGTDELAECDRILSDDNTDISEKTEAYGGTPYFTATYENGTYSVSATDAFLELVSADTEHEYAWDAYVQCERTWVTERHENVFTETFNNATSDSNVVWTYTPEHPSISVRKYKADLGVDAGSSASDDGALTVSGDTQIAFLITNIGDVPLVGVSVSDETIDGTGTVTGITFPDGWDGTLDPGESVTALGTLSGVEPGTTHTDRGTASGKSYYTGGDVSASDDWHGKADPAPIIQTGDGSGVVAFASLVAGTVALCAFVARRRRAA